jgi:hypothetical protein
MEAGGFTAVTIDTVAEISSAPTPRHPAIAYCQGTPLRNEIEARNGTLLEDVTDRAAQTIAARFGDGVVEGRIQAHIVVGSL